MRTESYEATAAIQTLEKAKHLAPNDPVVLSDLALAYAIRAERAPKTREGKFGEEATADLKVATNLAKDAAKLDPSNTANLSNLALMEQEQRLPIDAVKVWSEYLSLETDSGWKDEAQKNLKEAQALIEKSQKNPETSPRSFLRDHLDSEVYLQAAVRSWLPRATDGPVQAALNELANAMVRQHHDGWLRETVNGPHDPEGLRALGAAVEDNAQGDYTGALRQADTAIRRFRKVGANAAILWPSSNGNTPTGACCTVDNAATRRTNC